MQTGSSGTLIGWKSGQTTFVPSMVPDGGSVAMDSALWCKCMVYSVLKPTNYTAMRAIYYLMSGFLFMVLSAISLGNWVPPHKFFSLVLRKDASAKRTLKRLSVIFLRGLSTFFLDHQVIKIVVPYCTKI
jgi:hypothetical protein